MSGQEVLAIAMVVTTCAVLMAGFPVAFSLAGSALAFALGGWALGMFNPSLLGSLASRYFGVMSNEVLVAVPLFVLMGIILERSRIAEQLLETMGLLFGRLRGGLAIAVVIVGALLAASTGIVGATVVTMGLLSLPTMLKAGYDPRIATGVICASGTLGQIIPPSIVLVLLGDILQGANTQAQIAKGNWAPDPVSVVDLFAGAFIPGMMLVGLYLAWTLGIAWLRPSVAPALPPREENDLARRVVVVLLPPLTLMVAVLGSIIAGVATPTEAAAVGSVGALLLAARRRDGQGANRPVYVGALALLAMLVITAFFDLRMTRDEVPLGDAVAFGTCVVLGLVFLWGLGVAILRVNRNGVLPDVLQATLKVTAMVFVILLGASVFSLVFRGLGGDVLVADVLSTMPGGALGAMIVVMAVMFVLGFFLDFIEIVFVVVPIVGPVLLAMDLDPVWLGVMIAVNLQTSFLTPPFGFALFYLRGVAPPEVSTMQIYRGIVPFVGIQVVALIVIAAIPGMATWLPSVLFD
jgi:tripartite ATP-independent transporter DctM subunit